MSCFGQSDTRKKQEPWGLKLESVGLLRFQKCCERNKTESVKQRTKILWSLEDCRSALLAIYDGDEEKLINSIIPQ